MTLTKEELDNLPPDDSGKPARRMPADFMEQHWMIVDHVRRTGETIHGITPERVARMDARAASRRRDERSGCIFWGAVAIGFIIWALLSGGV